jgi:hypothetical protein
MAKVITAPESIHVPGFKVFLAGAIDMGSAQNWQDEIIRALDRHDAITLLNPRREKFDESTLDEQIYWELEALEAADLILMWFPQDAKAPVAMFETGLYLKSGKLLLGVEPGFYRRRNLEITSERYGVSMWSNLQDIVAEVIARSRP